jgi:hypothetical protein
MMEMACSCNGTTEPLITLQSDCNPNKCISLNACNRNGACSALWVLKNSETISTSSGSGSGSGSSGSSSILGTGIGIGISILILIILMAIWVHL